MNYLIVVGGVALLQIGFSYIIVLLSQGNGSFVGLGAMLLAIQGVPLTALFNFWLIRARLKNPIVHHVRRLFLISLVLPVLQTTLLAVVALFRL